MIIISRIDYDIQNNPIIVLNTGKKLKCKYIEGIGENTKSIVRRNLQNLIGHKYKSIDTLKWYVITKSRLVKSIECYNVNLQETTMSVLRSKLIESDSRYNIQCFNSQGNLIFTKQFYDDCKKAVEICNKWKHKYYYIDVIDTVIGCEYYNPYEK